MISPQQTKRSAEDQDGDKQGTSRGNTPKRARLSQGEQHVLGLMNFFKKTTSNYEEEMHEDSDSDPEPEDFDLCDAMQRIVGSDNFDCSYNNRFYCVSCGTKISATQPGIDQLRHLISPMHLSNMGGDVEEQAKNLSKKIKEMEGVFALLQKLEPSVVGYIKRRRLNAKMNKAIKTVNDECQFMKMFQRDFWYFVCNLGSIPGSDSDQEREEYEVLEKICDPGYIAQCQRLKSLNSHLLKFHDRLSKFSSEAFKEEIKKMVSIMTVGLEELSKRLASEGQITTSK